MKPYVYDAISSCLNASHRIGVLLVYFLSKSILNFDSEAKKEREK